MLSWGFGVVRSRVAHAAVGLCALVCTGCPSPNHYGTPRTLPPGKVAHLFAAEAAAYGEGAGFGPTYGLRVGALDRVDAGVRLGMLSALGGDLKLNFERSKEFDMAIGLNVQYLFASTDPGDGCDTFVPVPPSAS